ncbi:tetratricopeptide repeat protein [Paraglaciecola aestuariivivens]
MKSITRWPQKTSAIFLFLLWSCISLPTAGQAYQPSKEQVVASWDNQQALSSSRASLQNIAWHLEQSQYPGQSNLHLRQASQMLHTLANSHSQQPEYWYYQARVLEHQHQFQQALASLDKALDLDRQYASAWLMKSNVQVLMGHKAQAKTSCTELIGLVNVDIALACSLQTAQGKTQVKQAYQKLLPIVKRLDFKAAEQSNTQVWLIQLAADMALALNKPEQAVKWLSVMPLAQTSISYLSQWADAQFELGNHQEVYQQLAQIVEAAGFKDDALLMRLAIAEKHLAKLDNLPNDNQKTWQLAAAERVELRVLRQDKFHAADLGRFFIFIQPNQTQALYWAEQNLSQSQTFHDYQLLELAKTMGKGN